MGYVEVMADEVFEDFLPPNGLSRGLASYKFVVCTYFVQAGILC